MTEPLLRAVDHTGFTVSSLDDALAFWIDGLGFTLSHRGEMGGAFLDQVTGVPGAAVRAATLLGPGHNIELLEYTAPADRGASPPRPCDLGAAHVAFVVDDLPALLERAARHGFHPAGEPQPIPAGRRSGTTVVYLRGPDGLTVELMQPPGT